MASSTNHPMIFFFSLFMVAASSYARGIQIGAARAHQGAADDVQHPGYSPWSQRLLHVTPLQTFGSYKARVPITWILSYRYEPPTQTAGQRLEGGMQNLLGKGEHFQFRNATILNESNTEVDLALAGHFQVLQENNTHVLDAHLEWMENFHTDAADLWRPQQWTINVRYTDKAENHAFDLLPDVHFRWNFTHPVGAPA